MTLIYNPAYPSSRLQLELRTSNDSARAGWMSYSDSWSAQSAGGAAYKFRMQANSERLLIYNHTWGGDQSQLSSDATLYRFVNNGATGDRQPRVAQACPNTPNVVSGVGQTNAQSDALMDNIKAVIDEAKRKTGLLRVYMIGASGGALTTLNFLGKYPGVVDRASVWAPVFDLQTWYNDLVTNDPTDAQHIRANLVSTFGHAPSGSPDTAYLARSPKARLANIYGPLKLFINTGSADIITPKWHGEQARDLIQATSGDVEVIYKEWTGMVHGFCPNNDGLECAQQMFE